MRSAELVQVSNGDEVWQGTTCGIERDGALRLRTESDEIKLVRAGDVFSVQISIKYSDRRLFRVHPRLKSMPKRIILNTFGSFGDIHPYMAIAMELQRRGHKPVIATMEVYREKVEGIGVEFVPVRPNIAQPKEQDPELIEKIMEPKTGPRFLTEEVVFPAVRESYADLLPAVAGADLLVTHPAAPAGPLVGRKTGMPWISTVLAPLSFFSAYDPPMPPFWQWFTKLSVLGPGVMGFLLRLTMSTYKAKAVTAFRDELGIEDYGNPMFEGQHSPALVLALFSRVFAQPQPDWPKQTEITGFCFYDGNHDAPVPPELTRFLENGPPPIVFTLGSSAVWVARDFFQESIQAAKRLGRRAVLLIGDERNLPHCCPKESSLSTTLRINHCCRKPVRWSITVASAQLRKGYWPACRR